MIRRPKRISASVVGMIESCTNRQFILRQNQDGDSFINKGVYVLQLKGGKIYVGKSGNIHARIQQHKDGEGCEFAKKVVKRIMPHVEYCVDFESWERAETLYWMSVKGIDKVRGWMYTMKHLTKEQKEHAFHQICERYDLCRKCGKPGHFVAECREGKEDLMDI